MTSRTTSISGEWDTAAIRRAMRVLSAHAPDLRDAQATARGLRIVWDILQRRGVRCEVYQVPGVMPLIVAGNGPLLVCTFIDDQTPVVSSQRGDTHAATVSGDVATGVGVTRRAGLLAAIGPIVSGTLKPEDVTLVIEADRHLGSAAIHSWLNATDRAIDCALWEAVDLPVRVPALFRSATGTVTLEIAINIDGSDIESLYAGVLPDIGHRLVETLAALKSRDAEVLVPDFYDGVETPDQDALDSLRTISSDIHAWISRSPLPNDDDTQMSATHMTLGVFCAPSIVTRSIELPDTHPFMPRSARAIVEARLMAGQDAHAVSRSLSEFVRQRIPNAQVTPLLIRQPYQGALDATSARELVASVYPTAPGESPAGILSTFGIPSVGFATTSRVPQAAEEEVRLSSIPVSSQFIVSIASQIPELLGLAR